QPRSSPRERGGRIPRSPLLRCPLPRAGRALRSQKGTHCRTRCETRVCSETHDKSSRWGTTSSDHCSSTKGVTPVYRVVLLGDPGVGKTSLLNLFAGVQDRSVTDSPIPLPAEAAYERTLCVDGEETRLLGEGSRCLQVGDAYVLVYSVTDRGTFESASELRIQLRRARQADDVPIILVGNKSDLVRCREVSEEEGQACAVVFDCKFIETSAPLQHNVAELFEGVVRQIRLRRGGRGAGAHSAHRRKESLTARARRFLDRLVPGNSRKVALKVRSKSCHDLSVP
uniref:GTP-binding protein n=1 Tax=Nothoprocta perdicaria TaxID=30464 RepID=A0A8C6ZBT3_NOTPE